MVERGHAAGQIADRLAATYTPRGLTTRPEVLHFVATLAERDLLAPIDPQSATALDDAVMLRDKEDSEAPELETFSDLQDILLLNPIHDVDPSGWPVAPEGRK